jgi:L-fuconolactonase
VLDAHVHLWDTARVRYALFAGDPALDRSRLLADYVAQASPLGVRQVLCVEAASAGADGWRETEWLLEHVGDDPRVAGLVAWAPLGTGGLGMYLRRLREHGGDRVVGIRRSFEFEPPDFPRRPEVIEGARLAGAHGLVVDLVLFPASLPAVVDLVRACPETSFVLDHLGKPPIAAGAREPWASRLAELSRLPNVAAKLSGLAREAGPEWSPATLAPYVDHAVACFGAQRLMIGSDWPIAELAGGLEPWFAAVRGLLSGLPAAAVDAILETNARRLYAV